MQRRVSRSAQLLGTRIRNNGIPRLKLHPEHDLQVFRELASSHDVMEIPHPTPVICKFNLKPLKPL